MTLFETNCHKREKGKKRRLASDEYVARLELIWVLFREPLMPLLGGGGGALLGVQGQGKESLLLGYEELTKYTSLHIICNQQVF